MHHIAIPDPLYREALRTAQANGVSLERFIQEAVQLHLNDEVDAQTPLQLSPDQVATIQRSQAEIEAGEGLTMEQVEARLAGKKAAWQQPPH